MNDRDRYPSYLTESLNEVHHYLNYRGRSYQDLVSLQNAVDDLNLAINIRLIRDFKDHPEMVKLFKMLETKD